MTTTKTSNIRITSLPTIPYVDESSFTEQMLTKEVFTGAVYTNVGRFGDSENFMEIGANNIKSSNFVTGSTGWQLTYGGILECQDAIIRGNITADTGTIGGWIIDADTLKSTNNSIILDAGNDKIESGNYVSGIAGSGFHLSSDLLEVGNVAIRGIIRSAVFETGAISAIGGSFAVLDADTLAVDMTALDASTLTIDGNTTFSVNDILRIKDGTDDEWLVVTNTGSAPTYTVTRDAGTDYAANTNPAWTKGASVINYGATGDGGVYMTASETNAPYLSIFTHAGSPWDTLTTRLRIVNLNGYLDYTSDLYGIGIGETDKYLKYDPTNGLRLKGNLNRNDFHWTTVFESIDGFGTGGTAPVISSADVKLTTGGTTNDTSSLRKTLNLPFYYFNWDFDRRFRTRIEFENNAAQEIWMLSGAITTNKHIGFKVVDDTLYGTVANGSTESTLDCGAVSLSNEGMALDVIFESGVGCTFIVDGVTKGTITTNLPSGVGFAQYMLELYIKTTENVVKEISLSFWDFWQSV